MRQGAALVTAVLALAAQPASAELDLARAGVARFANGLTVIVLEDHTLPVVSTQVLYKGGSRDETAGKTGLAHFLEHLAFRASETFPGGAATDAIYDAGGEWHGYTWLDQTTYFSTAPSEHLDLLLAIEADRMARVTIDPAALQAEKGAVITELRGYANDPSSVLFDAVAAAALEAHPYRNNTIGYESDVAALTLEDVRAFYERHYAPGNAVLAIVGDVDASVALERAEAHFGMVPARATAQRVQALEPPQTGARRVELTGPVEQHYLRLAYPAPAASSADLPAFLLMQQLLSGGSGVNFRQNDWGTPSVEGAALHGAAADVASWFIPTADPYLFVLSASTDGERAALEGVFDRRIAAFRASPPGPAELEAAKAAVREQLAFDLKTTEDAAHQLAFFEGLGALPALLELDDALDAVTPADIARLARTYLDPARRTVGWYGPGAPPAPLASAAGEPQPAAQRLARPGEDAPAPPPELHLLSSGLPVIVRPIDLSPTVAVMLVAGGGAAGDLPAGDAGVMREGLAGEVPQLVADAAEALRISAPVDGEPSGDPATRLAQMLSGQDRPPPGKEAAPVLAVVSGAIEPQAALAALEDTLGDLRPGPPPPLARFEPAANGIITRTERISRPLAQAALGYTLAAPPPASPEGLAMRMLLYVLTHDYGGRLGDTAISDTGLVYYIGSDYAGDRSGGRIAITTGVDPGKIDAMEALLRAEIARLVTDPPTATELATARAHIIGREASAAMDNREIARHLARTWLATEALPDPAALATHLAAITPEEIARAARDFATGTIMRVDVATAPEGERP